MQVRRANYQAAIWRRALQPLKISSWPTWLWLAVQAWAWMWRWSCESFLPLNGSSCCPTGFVKPDQLRLNRDRVAPHGVVVTCRKGHFYWTEACRCTNCETESATPVNTIRCTWWLSDWWWWTLISYYIVLYFFNSTAGKSQPWVIIPVCLINTCSTTFNHIFIHLYINDLICTTPRLCQKNMTPVALRGRGTTSTYNCFPATGLYFKSKVLASVGRGSTETTRLQHGSSMFGDTHARGGGGGI